LGTIDFWLKKYEGVALGVTIDVQANDETQDISYTAAENYGLSGDNFEKIVISMDPLVNNYQGIKHVKLIDFLTKI